MNKLLLLPHIKGLIFVLKSSIVKKVSELSFCSRLKIYVLMVSKLLDLLYFAVKNVSFPKEIFHTKFDQENFPQKN